MSSEPWSSDEELVEEILGGSVEAFSLLYETYFPRVYRFAVKRLRDTGEAEDVTQEVFLTVFNVLASFRGQSSLLVWIFGITRNTVNRRFRPVRPPIESLDATAREGRLELTFSEPINREQVDLSKWQVEAWNYRWGKQYGSPHFKPSQSDQQGTEIWSVGGFELEDGGRRLVLSVPDLQPCDTLKLDFSVAAGELALDGPVFFTIYHRPK